MSKETQEFIALVALDDGSGNIACGFTDADGQLFESYHPARIEAGSAAGIGASSMSKNVWETEEGNRFTVRMNPTKPITTLDPNYQLSEANRVLAIHTMAEAGLGGIPCVVGCTLPLNQFYNKGDEKNPFDAERQKAKGRNLMKAVKNVYGAFDSPRIVLVNVYPEALTAYYYCASARRGTGRPHYPPVHKTLVVDLGEFTADLAMIGASEGSEDEILTFDTYEHGIHVMVEYFHTLLIRESVRLGIADAKSMTTADLKTIIARGYIGSNLETPAAIAARVDVSNLIQESANHLNGLLQSDIREMTRGQLSTITRIVFVGGGANWLGDIARKTWGAEVDIPEQPELAVMRGVHIMMQDEKEFFLKSARAKLAKLAEKQES